MSALKEKEDPGSFFTYSAAASHLGVSRDKVKKLVEKGKLTTTENPLDSRQKLIPEKEVTALKSEAPTVIKE